MYTYELFKEELVNQVKMTIGELKQTEIISVQKNNQEMLEGVTIKETGGDVAPVIYLKELYQHYLVDEDMSWCVEQVLLAEAGKTLINAKEILGSWDDVKDKVEMYLLKKSWNQERLEEFPYFEILDFAIVFRIRLGRTQETEITIPIKNNLMQSWGITEFELLKAAGASLQMEEFDLRDMKEIMSELLGIEVRKEELSGKQYVLTTLNRVNGAIGMLRIDLLKEFYNKKKEPFYILPSSRHELILLPDCEEYSVTDLRMIVQQANENVVDRKDWLSDEIYYFDGECVQIANEGSMKRICE